MSRMILKRTLPGILGVALLLTAQEANAGLGLTFIIDGDTFGQPFQITNSSDPGINVTRFVFDLGPTGTVFDPVTGGPPGNGSAGTPFTPLAGTAATTGLVTPVVVADGATVLDLHFTDFNSGEFFRFDLDVDPANPNASATVFGNQLIGALVTVDFSNGLTGEGSLVAVAGNPDAAIFVIDQLIPTPPADGVPEPATVISAGLAGLMSFAAYRRKRIA